jgi:ribosomal 50S subunit-recycling heat shock protein
VRLDVFLKISRLVPRRSLAQQFCDAGLIEVNGSKAKSSKEIKAGDEVKISRRNRKALIRVDSVPDKKQLSKELASEFYTVLSEEAVDDLA